MTEYTSRFSRLSFYVDGTRKQFTNGLYTTNNAAEIAILNTIGDAVKVATPEGKPIKSEAKPVAKAAAKPKATSKGKASVK